MTEADAFISDVLHKAVVEVNEKERKLPEWL